MARRLLKGKASGKEQQEGEDVQYHAMTNKQVLSELRMVPASLAVRVQRLKWWQEVSRRPLCNLQLIGAMFGESYWEDEE
eukprot:128182-Pyramimonas_sp.AAC.1